MRDTVDGGYPATGEIRRVDATHSTHYLNRRPSPSKSEENFLRPRWNAPCTHSPPPPPPHAVFSTTVSHFNPCLRAQSTKKENTSQTSILGERPPLPPIVPLTACFPREMNLVGLTSLASFRSKQLGSPFHRSIQVPFHLPFGSSSSKVPRSHVTFRIQATFNLLVAFSCPVFLPTTFRRFCFFPEPIPFLLFSMYTLLHFFGQSGYFLISLSTFSATFLSRAFLVFDQCRQIPKHTRNVSPFASGMWLGPLRSRTLASW